MKRGRVPVTDTIPKLDKVEYLFESLVAISDGATLDEIRLGLIGFRRELDRKTKKDLRAEQRPRARRLDQPLANTFWSNAREAVRELMKLGMVLRKPVPNTSAEFASLRERRFQLTAEGEQFLALGERDSWQFRDRFFCAMHAAHPYLQTLRRRLACAELYIPRAPRTAIPGDAEFWRRRPPEQLSALAAWIASSVEAANGQQQDAGQLERLLAASLEKTWARRAPAGDNKEVTRWVVKMVNEQVVHSISQVNGIGMDYIAFRHAVSLLNDLHVCWDTRSLSDRENGWTIWLTAEGEAPATPSPQIEANSSAARLALEQPIWIRRRIPDEAEVSGTIIETLLSDPRKAAGFSLIHEIRALVCHTLHIHGWYFDSVLRKMFKGDLQHPNFLPHFDAGGGDQFPASEEPFLVDETPYFLVTLVERKAA